MKNRVIIIHDLEHAKAALSAAGRLGITVTLMSAPGAAAYLGAAVFRDMVAEAARACPDAAYCAVLDCGEDAGLALGALRNGVKRIRVEAACEVKARIAGIAAQTGAMLWREDLEALDLLDGDGAEEAYEACRAWLAGGENS